MNKSNWKGDERLISSIFGTTRTPLSGGNSKVTRSDTFHKELFIEVKKRKRHAAFELWKKTKELATKEGKIPVVALRTLRSSYTLLIIEVKDVTEVASKMRKHFGVRKIEQ